MLIWFGGVVISLFQSLYQWLVSPKQEELAFSLIPIGMIFFGTVLVWTGKWFARNDIEWLSNFITKSLDRSTYHSQPNEQTANKKRPIVLIVVAGFFCLLAIISIVMAIGDFVRPQSGHSELLLVRALPESYVIGLSVMYSAFMMAMAYGVFNRYLVAWRAGLVFIVLGWGYTVLDLFMHGGEENAPPLGFKFIFAILSTLVIFIWLKWWHAQKIHFV
jgi:hypothetical protein